MAASGLSLLAARVSATALERRELVQALSAWLSSARGSSGFVSGCIAEDLEVSCAYLLTAAWCSREHLEAHLLGADFGVLLGALGVLGHDVQVLLTAAPDGSPERLDAGAGAAGPPRVRAGEDDQPPSAPESGLPGAWLGGAR